MWDLYANCLYVAIAVYTTFLQSYGKIHKVNTGPTADHCYTFFVYWTYIKAFNDVLFLPGTIVYDVLELIEHVVFLLVYVILLGTIGDKIPGLITGWVHATMVLYFLLVVMFIRQMICGGRTESNETVKRLHQRTFVAFNGLGLLVTTAAASLAEIIVTAGLDGASDWTANQIFCVIVLFNECYSWGVLYFLRKIGHIHFQYNANKAMRHLGPRCFILVGICIVATDVFANESLDPVDFSFIWFPLLWLLMPSAMLMEVEIKKPLELKPVKAWFDKLERLLADCLAAMYLTARKKPQDEESASYTPSQQQSSPPEVTVVGEPEPVSPTPTQEPQPIPLQIQPAEQPSAVAGTSPSHDTTSPQITTEPQSSSNNNEAPRQPADGATETTAQADNNNTSLQDAPSVQPSEPAVEPSNANSVQ